MYNFPKLHKGNSVIIHLPKKYRILFLPLFLLIFCIPIASKTSYTPEITMYWPTSDNHANSNQSHKFKNFLKNHFSYNIRPTQHSYSNNHHTYNKNSYYNSYIAYMSVSDFQYIFASISNKYEILNNYSLYAYPNFRSFARGLPCYKEFILALHNKIQTDKKFKTDTTHIPGFNTSEFHKFIEQEVHSIAKNQTAEKKGTLHVNDIQTLNTLAHNCIQKINTTHSLNNHERLRNRLIAIEQTCKKNKTALDKQLHKELCDTRNTMNHLERAYSHDLHVQILAPIVYRYATQAKNEHCPLKAFELSDFCHTITQVLENGMHILYDASSAIGKGIVKGAHDFATIEHWKGMATGALQLGLLFADAIGQEDALHYAMVLTATTNNTDALTIAAEQYCSYTQAQKEAISVCAQETYTKIKTMSWQELIEHGTEIGTTIILDTLALNSINGFSRATSNLVIKELNRALESGALLTEQYAVEVAGFGKLIVEEGAEVSANTIEFIKKDLIFLKQENQCAAQLLHKIEKSEELLQKNSTALTTITSTWKANSFAPGKLETHFHKHVIKKAEWGSNTSMTINDYLNRAKNLLNAKINKNIEQFISKNGWVFRYNKITNELAIAKPDGIIETLFRPAEGINYWIEQIKKYK